MPIPFTYYEYVDPFSSVGIVSNKYTIDDIIKPETSDIISYPRLQQLEKAAEKAKEQQKSATWFKPGAITTSQNTEQSSEEEPKEEMHIFRTESSNGYKHEGKDKWVQDMRDAYSKVLKEKGIDNKYVNYLIAQDVLESGWGKSQSGKYNFGGIKGKGTVRTTKEYSPSKGYYSTQAEFRDFDSLEDYARYKVDLLNNKRYHAFDGNDFASNVANGGYATDPKYKAKLTQIYNKIA